jgi:nucleoside-diphosphate-sugar epimerase
VLLLGGAGFLSGHVSRALSARGHAVTVLTRGRRPVPSGVEALVADRKDAGSLAAALAGRRFDFTVDFVAFDAGDVERLLLVPYAALGRLVMISTGQVYLVTENRATPYREEDSDAPLCPEPAPGTQDHADWTYGVGKRRAEAALLALRRSHGVRAVVLRIPILHGEHDGSLRLWAYLERMLDGGPLLVPDGGVRVTRHLYAGDVARVIAGFADGAWPREPVYNLAQPDAVPVRDLIERIADAAGVEPALIDAPWEDLLAAGLAPAFSPYAGIWSSVLDPSRAAAEWGFLGTRLDDYLPRVVRWHLEHRPARSHHGYAQRALEREVAARLGAPARRGA